MSKIPVLRPKEIIRVLNRAGFIEIRSKGSHIHLKKEDKLVTVPMHNRDLKIKTLKSILRQSNLTIEELQKYL
ncbi:MAG: type II toxin-antitoxin system HicA family toxin [Ignavibacteria bacterium]